ncbi:hypothetical protein QBC37DRAFT_442735 [Rhypophila decipiens]|uniref:Ice-binding protein n=1 Tax=Rhypophila decipiens TaxID=261697 RepID=A0AAN6Y0Q7_9PEZI|nr:hypothetical protein QBC37DRAFT_442735 [Rhypophila decipiens]
MRSLYAILCNIAFAASATAQSFNLGTASSFGVLAGSAVTNTGPTVIDGDLGLYPGTSHTGFTTSTPPGPGIVTGATNINDAVAMNALADALVAYNAASAMATTQGPTGMELGGLTLVPGVYEFDSTAQITGDLTLDASNDPTALFVFKIGSSLTTASNANVILLRGAQACNVIWRVGISATLGTDTEFNGIILASTSITATTGVNNFGSLFALNGAVTLDTNTITVDDTCNAAVSSSATPSSTTSTSTSSSSAVVSSSAGLSSSSVSSLSASASSSSAASSSSVGAMVITTGARMVATIGVAIAAIIEVTVQTVTTAAMETIMDVDVAMVAATGVITVVLIEVIMDIIDEVKGGGDAIILT